MRAIRPFIICATIVVAARTADAQGVLSSAKNAAQKAANATTAHVEAEQHPEAPVKPTAKVADAKPSAPAPAATKAADPKAAAPKAAAPKATASKAADPKAASKIDPKEAAKPTTPPADSVKTPAVIYREAFAYEADGRRDPFNSLLTTNELRPAMSDLRLTGILFDHSGTHSVATLRDIGTNAQYRVTVGSTLGRMRVSSIRYTTIVFTIDEFGMTRQDSLILRDTTKARGK